MIGLFKGFSVFSACLSDESNIRIEREVSAGPCWTNTREKKTNSSELDMSPYRFGNQKYHVDRFDYEPGRRCKMSVTTPQSMVGRSL
jgi:hypothetical protein